MRAPSTFGRPPAAMIVSELSPTPSVLDAFEATAGQPYRLLLDSARDPERLGRYSFVAADPVVVVRSKNARTELVDPRTGRAHVVNSDALSIVRALMAPFASEPDPDLPPFQGGAAGYIGYDWGAQLERLPTPRFDDLDIPDVILGIYDTVLAWDHLTSRCWRITTPALRTIPAGPFGPGPDRMLPSP